MTLEGKTAIVTGGGTGVGRATTQSLAQLGCSVLVNYSRSVDAAEESAEAARAQGAKAIAFRADVAEDAACRAMVKTAMEEWGRLDFLVNNAGTTFPVPLADLEKVQDDHWEKTLAVNLKGPFQCARAAKPAMEQSGGGCIVNVSSVAGIAGIGSSIPYASSKAALNNLTVILARVLGPQIRVNAVAPGFIAGSWLQSALGPAYEAVKKGMEARTPLQRVCEPQDVADAILGFITGSKLVTGQVLAVEGGLLVAG